MGRGPTGEGAGASAHLISLLAALMRSSAVASWPSR
jgi:hypothetical protein